MRTVTLYGKPDCCLCERARALLERMATATPFTLEEVDITAEDDLHKRFLVRIPVVALDGEELYEYEVDADDLAARLAQEPSRARRG